MAKKWHLFENQYLNYFIDPLCGFANFNYFKIIKDKRVFRNSLSWETEKYLKEKKFKFMIIFKLFFYFIT